MSGAESSSLGLASPTWRACAAAVMASCLLGCTSEPARHETAPPNPGPFARNLILISIDTLRADRLGTYGYQRETSPFLDEFASKGVVFDNARTPASWTIPAHGSMLTGLYPRAHGLRGFKDRLPSDVTTLAQRLHRAGISTIGFSNIWIIDAGRGFDRGFDQFSLTMPKLDGIGAAPKINRKAARFIAANRDGRFFVFLHYYDVHSHYRPMDLYERMFAGPYDGPADGTTEQMEKHRSGKVSLSERDVAHLSDLYDGGIRQMDAELKRFFTHLENNGVLDDTLVIITSDHGEEFLDHGLFLHGANLYEETVRVPMILRGPGVPAGRHVEAPASLVDITPTVLSLMGVAPATDVDGVDLSLAWRAPEALDAGRPFFFETDQWKPNTDELRWAILVGDQKLHVADGIEESETYDLAVDPGEQDKLARANDALRRQLDEYRAAGRKPEAALELRPEIADRLRELGYLGVDN